MVNENLRVFVHLTSCCRIVVCVHVHIVKLILLKPKPDMRSLFFLAGHSARKNANKRMQKNANKFDYWRHAKTDQILFLASTFLLFKALLVEKNIIKMFQEITSLKSSILFWLCFLMEIKCL